MAFAAEDTAALLRETRQQSRCAAEGGRRDAEGGCRKGVTGAISVYSEAAPAMLRDIRQKTGWDIRRVSLKARNAATGTPDAWEARQLAEFNIQVAEGGRADQLEVSEIVTGSDGKRTFRYRRRCPWAKSVSSATARPRRRRRAQGRAGARLPADRATGYSLGQVRGALSVKRPL